MQEIPTEEKNNPIASFEVIFWMFSIFILQEISHKLDLHAIELLVMVPRTLHGLIGIFGMHFLHSSFHHFIVNIQGLFISILFLNLMISQKVISNAIFKIMFITGVLVWTFARNHFGDMVITHIGASGLVYGLMSYTTLMSVYKSKYLLLFVTIPSLISAFTLQGFDSNISWESHIFGVIAGLIVAQQHHSLK